MIFLKLKAGRMAQSTYAGLSFTGTVGNTNVESFGRLLVAERLIGGLAGGILAFAFGELLRVLRDISLNARALINRNESILQPLEATRSKLPETLQSRYHARDGSSPTGAASSAVPDNIANVTTQPSDGEPAFRQNAHDASSPYDAGLAAQDIIATLMTKWRDSGRPSLTLAKTLIDAGVVQVARERGPKAAAAMLEELKAEM